MDFTSLFSAAKVKSGAFLAFGFEKRGNDFVLRQDISDSDFYAEIYIQGETVTAEVFEKETGERYALFDVKSAEGEFVADLRQKVKDIIEKIREKCFEADDVRKKYFAFVEKEFRVSAEYPWAAKENADFSFKSGRFDDFAVFRCENKKWFALIMSISYKNLGLESDEKVAAVNLKTDFADSIVDKKTIFPAYHMNKKYWVTVLLTSAVDFDNLCVLTKQSYALVSGKKKKKKGRGTKGILCLCLPC